MLKKLGRKNAYTLLEILLVLAAIAILSVIIFVLINPEKQHQKFRDEQRVMHQSGLSSALQQYFMENRNDSGFIPNLMQEICNTGEQGLDHDIDCSGTVDLSFLVPNYIDKIPSDPSVENLINQGLAQNNGTGYIVSKSSDFSKASIIVNKEINLCPQGFIPVPGNSLYGTEDFCVMKYEAKAVDTENGNQIIADGGHSLAVPWSGLSGQTKYRAVSVPEGRPWVSIPPRDSNYYDATEACQDIDARLISNNEWMTIARNIESVGSNWSDGQVGNGTLSVGNVSSLASMDGTDPLTGVNKRTHALTNGEVVWDMSGNVWNWTGDLIRSFDDQPNNSISPAFSSFLEWTDVDDFGSFIYDELRPSNSGWNSNQGMGTFYLRSEDKKDWVLGIKRGSRWTKSVQNSGVFAMHAGQLQTEGGNSSGFRCTAPQNSF